MAGRVLLIAYTLQTLLSGLVSESRARTMRSQGAVFDDSTDGPTGLLLVTFLSGLAILTALKPSVPTQFIGSLSLAAFVFAQALEAWSISSLGRHWCRSIAFVPGSPPVRHGPYRFLRHPIYVATIIEWLALAVLLGQAFFGVVSVCIAAIVLNRRAAVEDRLLRVPGMNLRA